ncbi:hypothetical protein M3J09_003997 [Ascochyta lentis]
MNDTKKFIAWSRERLVFVFFVVLWSQNRSRDATGILDALQLNGRQTSCLATLSVTRVGQWQRKRN